MILEDKDIDERRINKLIGERVYVNLKNLKSIGSPGLYLKLFLHQNKNSKLIEIDSKCNFEKRSKWTSVICLFIK